MSTQAWIFLVGLRVLDLGALLVWLVWFLKMRDEPDDGEDEGGGGGPPVQPSAPPRGPIDGVPLPDAGPWPVRLRDHTARRPSRTGRSMPVRHGAPARGCPARSRRSVPRYRL